MRYQRVDWLSITTPTVRIFERGGSIALDFISLVPRHNIPLHSSLFAAAFPTISDLKITRFKYLCALVTFFI